MIADAHRHAPPADLVRHRGVIQPRALSASPIRRLRAAAVPAPGGPRLVHDRLKLPGRRSCRSAVGQRHPAAAGRRLTVVAPVPESGP
jgi:hypothetical protein